MTGDLIMNKTDRVIVFVIVMSSLLFHCIQSALVCQEEEETTLAPIPRDQENLDAAFDAFEAKYCGKSSFLNNFFVFHFHLTVF